MQKNVYTEFGTKVGVYHPITGKFMFTNGNNETLDKQSFIEYCTEMGYIVV